jgi:glycerate 2-kinase
VQLDFLHGLRDERKRQENNMTVSRKPAMNTDLKAMREHARRIFEEGLRAVEPEAAVSRACRREGDRLVIGDKRLDLSRFKRVHVVGAGKASAPMARALEAIVGGGLAGGLVNVKYGHTVALDRIELIEAGHPIPDENGMRGAERMLDLLVGADSSDLAFCVISGGGSALLPLPQLGISLADKQETVRILLSCGASIHEINAVRKHISRIKGGQLARAAYPATVISLILSDVVGDDLDVIASGPTVPDSRTFQDCLAILDAYRIETRMPESVLRHLEAGLEGKVPETPKPGEPAFDRTLNRVVGSTMEAIRAAEQEAIRLGYQTLILSSMIEGETRHVARMHGAIAREIVKTGRPIQAPACILSGGETTVTITGSGTGGRNQEFALAAAIDIAGKGPIAVLSAGTDGTDGPTDAAGAFADSATVARARVAGLDPRVFLDNNDAYNLFKPLGDLLITGPTNTNVMDLRIMLVGSTVWEGDQIVMK